MADLAERIRKSRILRVTGWSAVMLTLVFLIFSRTKWYQIHQHKAALSSLQQHAFWAPVSGQWWSYLSTKGFYSFLYRNMSFEEKIEQLQAHSQKLFELGYLEERSFTGGQKLDPDRMEAALRPYLTFEPEKTHSFSFEENRLILRAPKRELKNWEESIRAYGLSPIKAAAQ